MSERHSDDLSAAARAVARLAETDIAAAGDAASGFLAGEARGAVAAELLVLAQEVGVLRGGFAAYRHFLLNHSRPWDDTGFERAADDPHTVRQWGRLAAELAALDALFAEAAEAAEAADRTWGAPPRVLLDARHFAIRLGETLHTEALEVLGAGATSGRFALDSFHRASARLRLDHPPIATLADLGRAVAPYA